MSILKILLEIGYKTIGGCNVFCLLALFKRGSRGAKLLLSNSYHAYLRLAGCGKLPLVELQQLIPIDDLNIKLALPYSGLGTISPGSAMVLAAIAKNLKPANVLEIGTCEGVTTRNIAMNAKTATVYTIDLPEGAIETVYQTTDQNVIKNKRLGCAFRGTKEERNIVQLLGDSATYDFKSLGIKFDMAYIDGSHNYEYVRNDTHKVVPLVRPGGIIIWDDYGNGLGFGVKTYLDKMAFLGVKQIFDTPLAALVLPENIEEISLP